MPLLTVEGIYRDGKVELAERPKDIDGSRGPRQIPTALGPAPSRLAGRADARPRDPPQASLWQMKEGLHLGGPPYPRREELHDRYDR